MFDAVLHFGTVLAVLGFYFKRILKITLNELKVLVIATIPAIVAGLFLKNSIDEIFQNTTLVGFALVVSGLMNIKTDKNKETTGIVSPRNGFLTGLFQAFAILPGISRSGSTIFGSTLLGIKKEKAAEYSFLLSIPAVVGANVLEVSKAGVGELLRPEYSVGILCSFVAGIVCIKILLNVLTTNKFKYFGYYCILIGIISLLIR